VQCFAHVNPTSRHEESFIGPAPEEEGLDEPPESSGKHDENEKDHDLGVPDDPDNVVQDPLAWNGISYIRHLKFMKGAKKLACNNTL
jgi:hypothetical protein